MPISAGHRAVFQESQLEGRVDPGAWHDFRAEMASPRVHTLDRLPHFVRRQDGLLDQELAYSDPGMR
jgi:hypothetical protein